MQATVTIGTRTATLTTGPVTRTLALDGAAGGEFTASGGPSIESTSQAPAITVQED